MASPHSSTPRLREILRGVPEDTIVACEEFHARGGDAAFDRAVLGVITHHLSRPAPQPLGNLPGTTTLVADLGLDSITMVEMVFLFEDVFNVKVPPESLQQVATLDDLRALLRAQLAARPSGAA